MNVQDENRLWRKACKTDADFWLLAEMLDAFSRLPVDRKDEILAAMREMANSNERARGEEK